MCMSAMKRLFQLMADKKASDIFLSVGAPINIKINGVAMPINQQTMDANTVRGLLHDLIGEIRDKEHMTSAIQYAQYGHLCLATLHANNSYHAMNRIISFYPLESRTALLQDLSATLKCVISQRLVKNVRGLRSAAAEIMLNSRHMADLIEKGEISEMKEAMEKALTPGSQTFEQSLFKMIRDGLITQDEGLSNADSANNLLWLINNTAAGADFAAGKERTPGARPAAAPTGSAPFSEFKLDETERA